MSDPSDPIESAPDSPLEDTAARPWRSGPKRVWGLLLVIAGLLLWLAISGGANRALPAARTPTRIAEVTLSQAGKSIRLIRKNKGWIVATAANAPARKGAVEALLQQLAHMRITGPATANRMIGAAPLTIQLADAKKTVLGSIRIDTARNAGRSIALISNTIKLVQLEGVPDVPFNPARWTDVSAPPLDIARVRRVTLIDGGGAAQRFSRQGGSGPFAPATHLPGDGVPDIVSILRAFDTMTRDGVLAAHDINWYGAATLLIETKDGLQLTVQVQRQPQSLQPGRLWLRVNGDPLPGAALERQQEARAFKALKAYAFDVPANTAAPLHGALFRP